MPKKKGIEKKEVFHVIGHINFNNVMSVYAHSQSYLSQSAKLKFNFEQLISSNSAALALVIEWIKFAKRHRKPIHFENLPEDLLSIAKVAGIDILIAPHIE